VSDDFHFDARDDVLAGGTPPGYRIVLDLSDADSALIDAVAKRDGLQPTEILTEALHLYAQRAGRSGTDVEAFGRLSGALRRNVIPAAPRRRVA
jgi:hypothetical protein